ncbi:MAG: PAS domain S-box protein [Bacteroidales bacterium]|nr:PAS domain S-box protein [Bacteroidales bacterium]
MNEIEYPKTTEQDLLAENRRLKNLLNKLSGLGLPTSKGDNSDTNKFLLLSISQILISEQPFKQRIESVLSYLGEFSDVSRVCIFEKTNNGNAYRNTFEWNNKDITPQINALQEVLYSDIPSWEKTLEEKGIFIASNIKDQLPEDLHPILEQQNIKSILIFPILSGKEQIGFISFNECSYSRQWIEIEKALLATSAQLLGNAYQQHNTISQINKSLDIQKFLYRVASSLNHPDGLENSLDSITREFIDTCNLTMVAIYNRENPESKNFELLSKAFKTGNGYASPKKITISSIDEISVFLQKTDSGFDNLNHFCNSTDLTSYGFSNKMGNIITTKTQNGINGVVVLIWNSDKEQCPVAKAVVETFSGLIAGAFDHRITNQQNKEQHKQILEINKLLTDKEKFLNSIISSAPVGIMLVKDRIIQYVNNHVLNSSLFTQDEILGIHFSEFYAKGHENTSEIKRFYIEIEEKGISSIDTILKRKDGTSMFINIIGTPGPQYSEDGYILLIGQDLTHVKLAENNLRESEERNKRIIEATIDGIFIMSDPGKLEYVNKSGCELTGYPLEELTKISLEQLFPEKESLKRFLKIFNEIRRGKNYKGDTQLRHRNGSSLFVEIYGTTITLDGTPNYYFNIHDITRRKQNEAALKLSENKFRTLSENLPDYIMRVNRSGIVTYSNKLFIDLFNLEHNEISGHKVFLLEELPCNVSEQFKTALKEVFNKKVITHLEFDLVNNNDKLTFDWSLSPELDLKDQCFSALVIGRNITHRKKVEQELVLAKDLAEAADRLKSAFLANLSHEIRTPLNAIVGFSNLLSQTDPESGDRDEYISLINNSADHLLALINDIIDIAKIESGHLVISKKPINVNKLIVPIFNTYQKRIEHQFKGKVTIHLSKPKDQDHLFIDADPSRLLQVFNNLLDNAIKFVHKGHINLGYSISNNKIRFFVKDTGIGIAAENQKMIFSAFRQEEETSSKKYGGAGLGLAISKKLIEAMGGEIHLISEKGKGSEFFFFIDGIELNLNNSQEHYIKNNSQLFTENLNPINFPVQIPNWSNRLLLLVDDNSSVHLQLKKQLEKTRITVLSARSASSARNLLLNRKDIDLVIMNNHLPDIDPSELSKQIRCAGVQIPLIIQTDGGESENEGKSLLQSGFDAFVNKPAQAHDLIPKISHLLSTLETKSV